MSVSREQVLDLIKCVQEKIAQLPDEEKSHYSVVVGASPKFPSRGVCVYYTMHRPDLLAYHNLLKEQWRIQQPSKRWDLVTFFKVPERGIENQPLITLNE
jgi:hypothetical protein